MTQRLRLMYRKETNECDRRCNSIIVQPRVFLNHYTRAQSLACSFFFSFSLLFLLSSIDEHIRCDTTQSTCLTKITRELNNRQDWCTCMCLRVWRKKKKREEAKKRTRTTMEPNYGRSGERRKREYSSFNTKDLPSAIFPVTSQHGRNGKVALRLSSLLPSSLRLGEKNSFRPDRLHHRCRDVVKGHLIKRHIMTEKRSLFK